MDIFGKPTRATIVAALASAPTDLTLTLDSSQDRPWLSRYATAAGRSLRKCAGLHYRLAGAPTGAPWSMTSRLVADHRLQLAHLLYKNGHLSRDEFRPTDFDEAGELKPAERHKHNLMTPEERKSRHAAQALASYHRRKQPSGRGRGRPRTLKRADPVS